jgi:hypothetical protein
MFVGETAAIPVGTDGLTGNKNLTEVSVTQLTQATNVSYTEQSITKEGGASKYNSSAIAGTPNILCGLDWWPSSSVQRMLILTSGGAFLKDSGAGTFPTSLAAGLTISASTVPSILEGGAEVSGNNRKAFLYSGTNQIKVLSGDGVVANNIATPPADWAASFPITGAIHAFRHMGAGNLSDPHRLYYSTTANHEDFTGAGSGTLSIYPGEGDRIVKIISFKSRLIVFKNPLGIYIVDTSDPTPANWSVDRLSRGVGLVGTGAVVDLDEDLLFWDASGVLHFLSAVREFGDFGIKSYANLVNFLDVWVRDNVNKSQMSGMQSIFYIDKKEVHFTVPLLGQSSFNRRIVLDYNQGVDKPRFRWNDRDVNKRRDANNIARPVWGDESGTVWLGDQANKNLAGAGYLSQFGTGDLDLSHQDPELATINKNFHFLELITTAKGNWSLLVDVYYDGILFKTINFNLGVTGASLGAFTLDTDMLSGDQVIRRRKRLSGSAGRIRLVARNNGANEDFSVAVFIVYFTRGSSRSLV